MLARMITRATTSPTSCAQPVPFGQTLLGVALVVLGLAAGSCHSSTPAAVAPTGTITPLLASLLPGQQVRFQTDPGPLSGLEVVEGPDQGVVTPDGAYHAPYFRSTRSAATVRAQTALGPVSAHIVLREGPRDESTCDPAHAPGPGDYVYVTELPDAIYRPVPTWPPGARERGLEGTVMVQAYVCVSGQVMDTRVVRSVPAFDAAAVECVRRWVFKPALSDSTPVAVWVGISIRFSAQ